MPDIWQHDGKEYLLASKLGKMALVDPQSGAIMGKSAIKLPAPLLR